MWRGNASGYHRFSVAMMVIEPVTSFVSLKMSAELGGLAAVSPAYFEADDREVYESTIRSVHGKPFKILSTQAQGVGVELIPAYDRKSYRVRLRLLQPGPLDGLHSVQFNTDLARIHTASIAIQRSDLEK